MNYERLGSGPPLILLLPQSTGPGGRGPLLRRLAEHHDVIHVEPGGSARSTGAPPRELLMALAEEVVELADGLDLDAMNLLCHSTGCGVGLSLAARSPERVMRLVLTTPWTHADVFLHAMQTLRKAAARDLEPDQYARFNAALLFPPDYRRAHDVGFARMAASALASPQDADDVARRLDAILAFDARPLWPKVRCPVMVLSSADDQLMPSWFGRETADGITGAELVELDGGGHMVPETRTEQFAEIALEFLARST